MGFFFLLNFPTSFYNRLEKENIKIEINGKLKDKIEMDILDITMLLGNALQNAYEATRQTKKMEIPSDLHIQTNKNDKLNHGFELKNIVSIIKKYDGEYYITTVRQFWDYEIITCLNIEKIDLLFLDVELKEPENGF
ncbi:hypothetical protein BCR32DRAFT_276991 [Anaeromyces robustus]|uniref:Histidine kinase/HSP90-like ATPase domain-containing protein n=1 Tax=Anaeromyces robustus TaxID=1754192 RepID=A0A1Y1XFX9_9FUNG|nr:hypothetical protein BCR32DRAFT_276991 [Anaeromyces robustus]|eukprot:ORX84602.1 hypothetical protein BCR32DRAFT_276991 [Anaeromyces robustus]